MTGGRVTVLTPTYRPDLAITGELCRSIDAHFRMPFQHLLVVPRRDRSRFAPLASENRRVLVAEDLLRPYGLWKLPLPSRIRIPGLVDRRLREQWVRRGQGRVSGWLVQQVIKLLAADLTTDDLLVFIDSDLAFIRDVDAGLFHVDGQVRLHRNAGGLASAAHHRWRASALSLLGIDPEQAGEDGFIGNVITWRRDNLRAMLARIAERNGGDWVGAVLGARDVSEYMLYGYFARYALPDAGGHAVAPFTAVHSLWRDEPALVEAFVRGLEPHHQALHIQSAITADPERRRALAERAIATAAGGRPTVAAA